MTDDATEVSGGLTREEAELLISLRKRLIAAPPEAPAGSAVWNIPEAGQPGSDAAVPCACGLWAASGTA